MEQAAQLSQIKISAYGIGGAGISDISSLVTDYTDVNKVATALAGYMKSFNANSATPITYYTQSMKIVGWKPSREYSDISSVDSFLGQYYELLQTVNSYNGKINAIFGNLDTGLNDYLSDSDKANLNAQSASLFSVRKELGKLASSCNSNVNDCKSESELRAQVLKVKVPDLEFVGELQLMKSTALKACDDQRILVGGGIYIGPTKESYSTAYLVRVPGDWDFITSISFLANGSSLVAKQLGNTDISQSPELTAFLRADDKQIAPASELTKVSDAVKQRVNGRWSYRIFSFVIPDLGGFQDQITIKWSDKIGNTNIRTMSLDKPTRILCTFVH